MKRVANIGRARAALLNRRRPLVVDLPEWIIRVVEIRVAEANDPGSDDPVTVNDVVEWLLVAPITLRDVPIYENAIPGVSAALSEWLEHATYDPPA
jgi:hypothetical protein